MTEPRIERIGDAILYLGDCRDILPTLPAVDAIVTDPPYGIGFAAQPTMYARKQGHAPRDWDSSPPAPEVIAQLIAAAPKVAIWGGNHFALPPSRGWLVWVKPDSAPSMADVEFCWTNADVNARAFHKSVKSSAMEKDMVRGFHPTQKSVPLMEWTIKHVKAAGTVLDPFAGSGTTGVACANLGLPFIGIEVERQYFEIACERITTAYSQRMLFA